MQLHNNQYHFCINVYIILQTKTNVFLKEVNEFSNVLSMSHFKRITKKVDLGYLP